MDTDTAADLSAWTSRRDEAAFQRLVEQHSRLVAAVCRRQLGNGAAADDAVQAVFIVLARRAETVSGPRALGPWLHGVALRVCRHARRATASRVRREREAAMHDDQRRASVDSAPAWDDMAPLLDDAVAALVPVEREIVIGHFLQGMPQAVVAQRLGISENAAQKRIAAALAKLRSWFSRHGMGVSATVLVAGLMREAGAAESSVTASCAQAALHPSGPADALASELSLGAMPLPGGATFAAGKLVLLATALTLAIGTAAVMHAWSGDAPTAPGASPATATGPAAASEVSFSCGWESGITGPGLWLEQQVVSPDRMRRVTDVVRSGSHALRIEVRPGDAPLATMTSERAQALLPSDAGGKPIHEHADSGTKYIALSVRLDEAWTSPVADADGAVWATVCSLLGSDDPLTGAPGASPAFALEAANGRFSIVCNGGRFDASDPWRNEKPLTLTNGSLNPGRWVDFVFGITFSTTSGGITVWRRDEGQTEFGEVLSYAGPTVISTSRSGPRGIDHYWKIGLHRPRQATLTSVLWTDAFVRADTFAAAVASAFPGHDRTQPDNRTKER